MSFQAFKMDLKANEFTDRQCVVEYFGDRGMIQVVREERRRFGQNHHCQVGAKGEWEETELEKI